MANLSQVLNKIQTYCKKYRNSTLPDFNYIGLYDLFPEKKDPHPDVTKRWPEKWSYLNEAGVYIFLSNILEILYIGKASMKNGLGYRLSSYCGYTEDRKCKLVHQWKGQPRYVFTIAVPNESRFEAPALEEYLITNIPTTDNKVGV